MIFTNFPNNWKSAKVVPLVIDLTTILSSDFHLAYRLSKIIECAIHSEFHEYLHRKELLLYLYFLHCNVQDLKATIDFDYK